MKYKRLAKKLGVKEGKPGDLIKRMHSLKGMPKAKKHKGFNAQGVMTPALGTATKNIGGALARAGSALRGNVMGPTRRPAVTSQPMAQARPAGLAMPKPNLANAVSGMKFKKSKKHKFGTGKGLAKAFEKKHKKVNDHDEDDYKKHKEIDFKKHKTCMKKHKHSSACE